MNPLFGYHRDGRRGDVRGAVTRRAALLVLGVLAVQLAFLASTIGAFHAPEPDRVPLAVAGPDHARDQVAQALDRLPGTPLDPGHTVSGAAEARRLVQARTVDGALVVDASGGADTLYVASASGAALSEAVTRAVRHAEREQRRTVEVRDLVPAGPGDARGLTAFSLVVGWCVGGSLAAVTLAVSAGVRHATLRRAAVRLGALLLYSLAAGLGGALIAGPMLAALPGDPQALAAVGALVVFGTGAATLALHAAAGAFGVGVAGLLVVVLGIPGAGGGFPTALLPPFWQAVGPALVPGAGTWSVRSLAYFDGQALSGPLLVLASWAAAGTVLTLALGALRGRRAWLDELTFTTRSPVLTTFS